MPQASTQRTRGNLALGESPWRVKSPERLRPKAFTRMRTQPGLWVGIDHGSSLRTSGLLAEQMTADFMTG
jgi:hypothetical protein